MQLYTIGFTQKTASEFFGLIGGHDIDLVVDVRLNNRSQLAGFTKGDDLPFFLTTICGCTYEHCVDFAPTKEILDDYKKGRIDWEDYARRYVPLMEQRKAVQRFFARFSERQNVCLLCSEPTPEHCHRRLLAELILAADPAVSLTHL